MDIKLSRRQFIKGAAVVGAGLALPLKFGVRSAHAFYQSPGLEKYINILRGVGPGLIPVATPDAFVAPVTGVMHFTINIEQFTDQLHPTFGPNSTRLWGFNPTKALGVVGTPTPAHLGGIILAQRGRPIQITFRNTLPPQAIIPVDTTLPGANQAQNRTAVHVHGGFVPWISDGGPFDWWAPDGTHGLSFFNNQVLNPGAAANEAEYYYGNDQSARMVWYHDHAMGITRTNAYAGIASAYIIRDSFEASMRNFGLPDFIENGGPELPIVIQDKIFVASNINTADPTWVSMGFPTQPGSLWYPHVYEKNRWRLLGAGRRLPNPSVIAEMFGDTMLANGTVYPQTNVEARPYRLRILNACNARFLNLQLLEADTNTADGVTIVNGVPTNDPGPNFLVIGTEAGFLSNPVSVASRPYDPNTMTGALITGNAERWDVVVDFTGLSGKTYILYTDAPAPFPGGDPRNDYYFGNPTNPVGPSQPGFGPDTRIIMKFNVIPAQGSITPVALTNESGDWRPEINPGIDPALIPWDQIASGTSSIPPGVSVRRLTLNEEFDSYGRLVQFLGTDAPGPSGRLGRHYADHAPTETPTAGSVEIWEIGNLTGDAHPIHFHLVNVQVLDRYPFDPGSYTGGPFLPTGPPVPPPATELGWKETVKMYPASVTRVIMKFDLAPILKSDGVTVVPTPLSTRTGVAGHEFVWHCHILEHEEHDMMRPLIVV